MNEILEPPDGCMEIPGYLIVIEPEKAWLTQDGRVTEVWRERGIWATVEEANAARDIFFPNE